MYYKKRSVIERNIDSSLGSLEFNGHIATTITRLKQLDVKMCNEPKEKLGRWCSNGGLCACLGCTNLMGWKNKQEWQDYMVWVEAGKPSDIHNVNTILRKKGREMLGQMRMNSIVIAMIN